MRKQVTTNVNVELMKLLKIEAVKAGVNYNEMLEDAIRLLLKSRNVSLQAPNPLEQDKS